MIKQTRVTIRVTREFKELLDRLSDEEDRSITNFLEWLVKQHYQRKVRGWN